MQPESAATDIGAQPAATRIDGIAHLPGSIAAGREQSRRTNCMLRHLSSGLAVAAGLLAAQPLAAHGGAPTTWRSAPAEFGAGTAETWITLDDHGAPVEIGAGISEAALAALHGHYDAALSLPLPPQAGATGFDHVLLNWNHMGHAPIGVFDVPHVDVHFYLTEEAAREAIVPEDPAYMQEAAREPAPDLMPTDFVPPPELEPIPAMGVHWSDRTDPVFAGTPFTQVLIYGAWDGAVTFIEPMVTAEVLETKETIEAEVKQPARVVEAGFYPSSYRIGFDAQRRMHVVVLEDLAWRTPD
jgi:Domain of unknown function (DUF5602)